MLKNKFISFLILAIITYSASFIGAISVISYKEPWYSTLNKASFNPPDCCLLYTSPSPRD